MVIKVADEIQKKYKIKVPYTVGTMIEVARAAITADEIATQADFFSFGTNDLTQTTYGLSRDDAGRFLPYYVAHGIFEHDPFITIDRKGVGLLMKMAIDSSRKIKKGMKMGICGEQVDPRSVEFCYEIGLTYVSGSPYRLPVATPESTPRSASNRMPKPRPWLHAPPTCTVCPFSRRAETVDSGIRLSTCMVPGCALCG